MPADILGFDVTGRGRGFQMKRLRMAIALALMTGAIFPASAAALPRPDRELPASVTRTDRVIVHWTTSASATPQRLAVPGRSEANARFVRTSGSGASIYQLDRRLGDGADAVLDALRRLPGVASVEPDLWMTADVLPNDTYASSLWGLLGPTTSPASPYGVDALGAWSTTRGAGATIAVIDTGLVAHPDLAGQTVPGYDMISDVTTANDGNGRDPDPSDPGDWCPQLGENSSWHGTHVAGTIAALANNAIGVFGGAPDARIEPVRALGRCGGYTSDIADGIRWAAGASVSGIPANAHPARVLNLSLGGSYPTCPTEYQSAIATARSLGAVVVVSAGNDAHDAGLNAPANCSGALTVAATGSSGLRASFSNYGSFVDIAAPGVGILSTVDSGLTTPVSSTYLSYSGTSMAAPHVSLSAALLAAAYPTLTPDAIEAVLEASATPFPADGSAFGCPTTGCGAGIVNASRALSAMAGGVPIVGSVTPAPRYPTPGSSVTVSAIAVDTDGIGGASARVGSGSWVPLSAADGAWGGIAEPVTGSVSVPGPDGSTTVCVRANDMTGHTSDGSACAPLGVDSVAPSVSGITFDPSSSTPGYPVQVQASASDGIALAGAEMQIDAGRWRPVEPVDGLFDSASEAVTAGEGIVPTSFAAGYHSCAVAGGGSVWCWGMNSDGEVGDSTDATRRRPVRVIASGATAVATSLYHSCALLADTTVRCWGYNRYGELGDGTQTSRSTPVPVSGLSGVIALSAGAFHTCALLADATVACWGYNGTGQLGDGTTISRRTPVLVWGLTSAVAIAAGSDHTCAVLANAEARCWGNNARGQLGDTTTTNRYTPTPVYGLTGVRAIAAGDHTCALLSIGTVSCWGPTFRGDLGDGANVDRHAPVTVVGIAGASAIALGWTHSCALVGTSVRCWGYNEFGQLGNGGYADAYTPVGVSGLSGAVSIAAGGDVSCAVRTVGLAVCWGYNDGGELGGVITGNQPTPTPVIGFGPLAAGSHQVCLRATDGAGHLSAETCATLPASGIPASPTGVTALAGDGMATVSWTAAAANGQPIASYTVTSTPSSAGCTTSGVTCDVSGLTNGFPYTFTVKASSGAGTSAASAASNAVTPAGLPGAVAGVSVRRRDGAVAISWSPADPNGSPIQTYTVTSSPAGHGCVVSGLSCVVEGLVNGTSYTFSVAATNGVGTGPAVASQPVIPAQVLARYAGTDRFATAADVSSHTFAAGCGCTAYIAYAFNFPDALAGAAAAGTVHGPVLLVNTIGPIDPSTAAELTRLRPARIVVLGSAGVVGDAVYQALATYAPSIARYAGTDRFATAAAISSHTFPSDCGCTAYIAYAFNFPDALAAAAAAGTVQGPVLLAGTNGPIDPSTAAELTRLRPAKIVVLGSAGVVSDSVQAALGAYAQTVIRIAGPDRYATAAAISANTFASDCGCTAYIAYAFNFPDALAGAAAAGTVHGPVLLVNTIGPIDPSTAAELTRLRPARIVVLGSAGVVGDAVYQALLDFIQ